MLAQAQSQAAQYVARAQTLSVATLKDRRHMMEYTMTDDDIAFCLFLGCAFWTVVAIVGKVFLGDRRRLSWWITMVNSAMMVAASGYYWMHKAVEMGGYQVVLRSGTQ